MTGTPQEEFWKGDFGVSYTQRNRVDWRARVPFWRHILELTRPRSVLEVGCNAGWNMRAIQSIDPAIKRLWGCDVNAAAIEEAADAGLSVVNASLFDLDYEFPRGLDLIATCGVLIHIAPSDIERAMRSIAGVARKHVLAVEYAADKEEAVLYRGHAERLWRRPFGAMYEGLGLKLVAQGEAPAEAFDRCRYWLMEKP